MEESASQRLWCTAAGLWLPGPVRRILTLSGLSPSPVLPNQSLKAGALVGTWGQSPHSPKAEALARRNGAQLVRIEDAFLRSIAPGRAKRRKDPPLGLLIDRSAGVHFDPNHPSSLETLLAKAPLDDTALLDRAREGMARLRQHEISKYNQHDMDCAPPKAGYVLIIDQTRDDAAIRASGAGLGLFREMVFRAQEDHPGAPLLIRSHPETLAGLRQGHFTPDDLRDGITLCTDPVPPYRLLEGAIAVYTVSSQLGFEAILAGHRPKVFGRPFYAGWGLTEDLGGPLPRRHRPLTRAQLFAAAMILAPTWYDPCRDQLTDFEGALDQLEAQTRAYRQDRHGHTALGMRLWKRGPLQHFFGAEKPLRFVKTAQNPNLMAWASHPEASKAQLRVEDGFLRSRGLGADLVPPLSLVVDDLGIYYDPSRPSRLEALIAEPKRKGQVLRAERLAQTLIQQGVTKYNLGGGLPKLPQGHRILVPGQVEDDASIRLGTTDIRTNLDLLRATRAHNPEAVLLWKPHPDVEAGLRKGAVPPEALAELDLIVLPQVDAAQAIAACDEVWTMTSGLGFEALLRNRPVTCLGLPFYAGWGLTRDLRPTPDRRKARPDLASLIHAVLIDYPRYYDPIRGKPCPPEIVVERIAHGRVLPRALSLRLLAKAQGAMAGHAWIWRR